MASLITKVGKLIILFVATELEKKNQKKVPLYGYNFHNASHHKLKAFEDTCPTHSSNPSILRSLTKSVS